MHTRTVVLLVGELNGPAHNRCRSRWDVARVEDSILAILVKCKHLAMVQGSETREVRIAELRVRKNFNVQF